MTIINIIIILILVLGFLLTLKNWNELQRQLDFTNDFRNKFVELSNKYFSTHYHVLRTDNIDNELYYWLTKNAVKMQADLGRFGVVEYIAPFQTYRVKNYEVILNTLPKYRDGKVSEFDVNTCDDTLIRYVGVIESELNELKKEIKNPVIWLQRGFRTIISFPMYLLKWFGIINESSLSRITGSLFFKITTGIIGLVAFISSVVTIIQGREETLKFFEKLLHSGPGSMRNEYYSDTINLSSINSLIADPFYRGFERTVLNPFLRVKELALTD